MKLRYLFSIILSALFFAGCVENPTDSWDNIKLSQTYVSISVDGGSSTVTVNATEDWAFEMGEDWPSWLTVSPVSGTVGETPVTFTADANQGREAEVTIKAGENTQFIRVRQGSLEAASATCAEVNAGPDGKTYKVKGTVTSIVNTTYGNWYLEDATGSVYVYGTLDKDGKTKNFASLGLEVGDVVEVQGPKTTYGTTVELVDVTVLSISKAFAKIVTEEKTVVKEGEQFDVEVAYKGEGLFPSVPEEYRSWVSIVDVQNKPGEPTKIEPNPADTAVVKIAVLPNAGGDRAGSVNFTSSTTTVPYNFTQEGAIIETTADEINAAEDGATQYRLTGYVSNVASTQYGNLYIKDYTGEVYVYGSYDENGDKFSTFPVKAGDIITVVGVKTSYNGKPQMKNVKIVKHISVEASTVADFLAAAESKDVYYSLTGTVSGLDKAGDYGNIYLTDKTGEAYVYGLLSGWGGPKAKFQDFVKASGLKDGDELTIVGVRAAYKGSPQVGSAFYVSHKAASTGDDNTGNEGDDDATTSGNTVSFADKANRTVFTTEQQVWAQNGVTVTNDKASSTNDVADYADPARFYKGSSLKVEYNGMKKIEFFCDDYKETYPTDLKSSITDANAAVSVEGTKVTVTFANAVDAFTVATLAG